MQSSSSSSGYTDYDDENFNLNLYETGVKQFTLDICNRLLNRIDKYKCDEMPMVLRTDLENRLNRLKEKTV